MKIDNFNRIETLLKEDDPEFFYDVQVLRRGKDHPELPAANWCVKSICVHGKNNLIKHIDEIIKLCNTFEARAYISLMRRSNRKCIENAVKCYAERLYNGDNKKPEAIWWHAVGTTVPEERIWTLDVDSKNWDAVLYLQKAIENCRPNIPIISVIPTVSGNHIIAKPFDVTSLKGQDHITDVFTKEGSVHILLDTGDEVEIKKHGLTLLYA